MDAARNGGLEAFKAVAKVLDTQLSNDQVTLFVPTGIKRSHLLHTVGTHRTNKLARNMIL